MSPEAYRQMQDAALKRGLNGTPVVMTPEQQLLERANQRRSQAAKRFAAQIKLLPTRPSYNEAVEQIYPILRDEFKDFNKEDFAVLACMVLAITAAETLRDANLI